MIFSHTHTHTHTHTYTVRLSMSIEPVQTVVNASDTAELTCIAQGFPLPTIAWSREDTDSLEFEDNVIEEEEGVWTRISSSF